MSRSTCITCGAIVRDHDPEPDFTVLWLPEHDQPGTTMRCELPCGDWSWNDGRHFWDCDAMKLVRVPSLELETDARNLRAPSPWRPHD